MNRIKNLKKPRIYLTFVIALVIMAFFFPKEGRFSFKYSKGKPWVYETLISPIDFPILKSKSELLMEKEARSLKSIPYYNYDSSVESKQKSEIAKLQMDSSISPLLFSKIDSVFSKIFERGVIGTSDISLVSDDVIVIQRDKRAVEAPSTEVYDISRASALLLSAIPEAEALHLTDYIVPNLLYDQKKSELLQKEAVKYVSPTKGMIYTGQLIVSEGEIVTAEIEQLLDSYKAEYENNFGFPGSLFGLVTGQTFSLLIVLALIFGVMYFVDIKVFNNSNQYTFILAITVLIFLTTIFVRQISPSYLYIVPYAVFSLYLVSFFKQHLAFPLYVMMLLPLLLISQNGIELFVMNLFSGAIAMVAFYYLNRGWLQFINALFIFVALVLVSLTFRLVVDGDLKTYDPSMLFDLALNALFVVAAYPLVFLFEKIFSLISNSKLKDLSDTSNKLLLELANKAPGTFQHSLQVSNLADSAAREIGGDVMLVRVGALYHDIGKMANPQCFVENQPVGVDFHSRYSPIDSAQLIMRHVDDGVEIARKNKLPETVIDFIKTHHAQTLTAYFYNSYVKQGGDPENKEPFTYHGDLPSTKEQVIVLMADAVEAASRSLKDYSEESISALVESIIAKRLSDSQLVNADISIREITIVKEIFKKHLMQVYHERIAYPDMK